MKIRVTRSVVPNLLTLGNLFSGFVSIVSIAKGNYRLAGLYIIAALFFDMFDGIAARLIGATSELGAELDSLCDTVSFGVAPAYLLYSVFFHEFGNIGLLAASLPALFGALRLAKFNTMLENFEDKTSFTGLPIPSAAMIFFTFVIFVFQKENFIPITWHNTILVSLTIIISLAMVSNIKFQNIPRPSTRDLKNRPIFSFLFFIALTVSIITKGEAIFYVMVIYLLSGIPLFIISYFKKCSAIEEFEEEWEE